MKFSRLLLLALAFLAFCLLSACGPLSLQIEPILTPTPVVPTLPPLQITLTPTRAASTPTLPPPPVTATVTPAGPDLRLKPGTALKMVKTRMLTALTGWAVAEGSSDLSQHILFTSDGGATWKDRSPQAALLNPPASGWAVTAYFASADAAWAIYAGRAPQESPAALLAWRTQDGGKTWEAGTALDWSGLQQNEYHIPSDMGFLDVQHGWVLVHLGVGMSHDYVALFTTADGGKTWGRVVDPERQSGLMACYKTGALFTSANHGWISGDCPGLMPKLTFFHTSDAGLTWPEAALPVPTGKPANYFAQNGIACGILSLMPAPSQALAVILRCTNSNNSTAQSWLYTSSDNGVNWSQRALPVLAPALDLLNANEAILVGSLRQDPAAGGAVYRSTNAGADWTQSTLTTWIGSPDFVDLQTGWVIANYNQVTAFVRTLDGGRTWTELKPVVAP